MTETVAPIPAFTDSDFRQICKQTRDKVIPVDFGDPIESVEFIDQAGFVAPGTPWAVLDSLEYRQSNLSFIALMSVFVTQLPAYIAGRNIEFISQADSSPTDPQYYSRKINFPIADGDSVDLFDENTPNIEVPGHTIEPGAYYLLETSTYNTSMQSSQDSLATKTTVFFAAEQLEANFDLASMSNPDHNNIITRILRTQEKRARQKPYSTIEH